MALDLDLAAKVLATLGFGLFLWPMIQRVRGLDTPRKAKERSQLRSREWWLGFVLICLALLFQRLAAQQAGG
ncbi:MAG: hypothetical protein HEQ16_16265 [Bosea sp.]|nr:hypothetical protein [Bosea sp. (in: a-proteobacteria)]